MRRCFFFFFKQKTAYEMRISDWSSDVCSSDLRARDPRDQRFGARLVVGGEPAGMGAVEVEHADQPVRRDDRHDEFAAAGGIAGDMAGKGVDVLAPLARPPPHRGAATGRYSWWARCRPVWSLYVSDVLLKKTKKNKT